MEACSYEFYPIFSGEKLVLLALVHDDGTIEWTQGLVENLEYYVGEEIAIIYDMNACYAYKEHEEVFEQIRNFSYCVDGRGTILNNGSCGEISSVLLGKKQVFI